MRANFHIVYAAPIVLSFAHPASALGPAECKAYADEAMQQIQEANALGCEFGGDQWGNYREGHLRWCRSADAESVARERFIRSRSLDMCSPCASYADAALQRQRENLIYNCGGTGDRWSFDRGGHLWWCMANFNHGSSPGPGWALSGEGRILPGMGPAPAVEAAAREGAIASCKAKYNESQIAKCTNYRDQAVQAINQLVGKRSDLCGISLEGRWSANPDQHFGWCMRKLGTPFENEIQSEAEARANELKSCETVDYGGCASCGRGGPSGGNAPRPLQSSAPGTPGGKQIKARAKTELPSSATAVRKPVDAIRSGSAASSSAVGNTQRKTGGGSAMDRLSGDGTASSSGGASSAERSRKSGGAAAGSGASTVKGPDAAAGGAKDQLPQYRLQPAVPTVDPRITPR